MTTEPVPLADSPYSIFRKRLEVQQDEEDNHQPLAIVDRDGAILVEDEFGGLLRKIIECNDVLLLNKYLPQSRYALWPMVPFHWDVFYVAADHGSIDVLQILLERHANSPVPLKPIEERGFLLLNLACASARVDMVRWLLDNQPAYANIHAKMWDRTPLILAAGPSCVELSEKDFTESMMQARINTMMVLLDHGASAGDLRACSPWAMGREQAPEQSHDTILSLVMPWAGHDLVQKLASKGAGMSAKIMQQANRDIFGSQEDSLTWNITLLSIASLYSNTDGIEALLALSDGSVEITDTVSHADSSGRLPLHWAAAHPLFRDGRDMSPVKRQQHAEKVVATMKLLLSLDPNTVNIQDEEGNTALHYAAGCYGQLGGQECTGIIKLLCENGADASLQNKRGQSPLHRLVRRVSGGKAIDGKAVALLLAHGSAVSDVDEDGNTPLHHGAAHWVHTEAAKLLVDRGAQVWTKNGKGDTPLHEASNGRIFSPQATLDDLMTAQDKMMQVLVEAGGEQLMDQVNAAGESPRHLREVKRARLRGEREARAGGGRGRGRVRGQGPGRGGVGMGRGMGRGRGAGN